MVTRVPHPGGRYGLEVEVVRLPAVAPADLVAGQGHHRLLLLRRGRIRVERTESRGLARPGDLILIPVRQRHRLSSPDGAEALVLRIRPRLFAAEQIADRAALGLLLALAARAQAADLILRPPPAARAPLRAAAEALLPVAAPTEAVAILRLKARFLEFLALLGEVFAIPGPLRPAAAAGIQAALALVEERSAGPLPVAAVIRASGLGRDAFYRVFRATTGLSFCRHLERVRVARAAHALRGGATPLAAAFDSGFNSVSRFYVAFRRQLGTSPARYRREG